jgi:metal-responsive CopG/Arc/MetJ family transcriptional regulator
MARPKSFRNPTRVSLTLDRKILRVARRVAREKRRSLSEMVSEILRGYLRANGARERRRRA